MQDIHQWKYTHTHRHTHTHTHAGTELNTLLYIGISLHYGDNPDNEDGFFACSTNMFQTITNTIDLLLTNNNNNNTYIKYLYIYIHKFGLKWRSCFELVLFFSYTSGEIEFCLSCESLSSTITIHIQRVIYDGRR